MCDVAQTLLVERVREQARLTALAVATQGQPPPDVEALVAEFVEALDAPFAVIDQRTAELREAVGLPP